MPEGGPISSATNNAALRMVSPNALFEYRDANMVPS